MDANYNTGEWAEVTSEGRRIYNYGYRLSETAFRGWRLIKVVGLSDAKENSAKAYFFENPKNPGQEILRIDVMEAYSWQSAQAMLHTHLSHCMRPFIPNGTGKLSKIGDINFVSRVAESDIPAAIFFTRGNIFLSMNSVGEKNIDLSDIAAQLDDDLSKPAARRITAKEKSRELSPKGNMALKAIEAQILIPDIRKVSPKGSWVQIIVPDGELIRKDDSIIYFPETAGPKKISIVAVTRK